MEQNWKTQFQKYKNKRNFKKTDIKGLWGQGIIFGEEDVNFEREKVSSSHASSTVKWKSSEGLLFVIKLTDLERETRNQVRIVYSLCIERIME